MEQSSPALSKSLSPTRTSQPPAENPSSLSPQTQHKAGHRRKSSLRVLSSADHPPRYSPRAPGSGIQARRPISSTSPSLTTPSSTTPSSTPSSPTSPSPYLFVSSVEPVPPGITTKQPPNYRTQSTPPVSLGSPVGLSRTSHTSPKQDSLNAKKGALRLSSRETPPALFGKRSQTVSTQISSSHGGHDVIVGSGISPRPIAQQHPKIDSPTEPQGNHHCITGSSQTGISEAAAASKRKKMLEQLDDTLNVLDFSVFEAESKQIDDKRRTLSPFRNRNRERLGVGSSWRNISEKLDGILQEDDVETSNRAANFRNQQMFAERNTRSITCATSKPLTLAQALNEFKPQNSQPSSVDPHSSSLDPHSSSVDPHSSSSIDPHSSSIAPSIDSHLSTAPPATISSAPQIPSVLSLSSSPPPGTPSASTISTSFSTPSFSSFAPTPSPTVSTTPFPPPMFPSPSFQVLETEKDLRMLNEGDETFYINKKWVTRIEHISKNEIENRSSLHFIQRLAKTPSSPRQYCPMNLIPLSDLPKVDKSPPKKPSKETFFLTVGILGSERPHVVLDLEKKERESVTRLRNLMKSLNEPKKKKESRWESLSKKDSRRDSKKDSRRDSKKDSKDSYWELNQPIREVQEKEEEDQEKRGNDEEKLFESVKLEVDSSFTIADVRKAAAKAFYLVDYQFFDLAIDPISPSDDKTTFVERTRIRDPSRLMWLPNTKTLNECILGPDSALLLGFRWLKMPRKIKTLDVMAQKIMYFRFKADFISERNSYSLSTSLKLSSLCMHIEMGDRFNLCGEGVDLREFLPQKVRQHFGDEKAKKLVLKRWKISISCYGGSLNWEERLCKKFIVNSGQAVTGNSTLFSTNLMLVSVSEDGIVLLPEERGEKNESQFSSEVVRVRETIFIPYDRLSNLNRYDGGVGLSTKYPTQSFRFFCADSLAKEMLELISGYYIMLLVVQDGENGGMTPIDFPAQPTIPSPLWFYPPSTLKRCVSCNIPSRIDVFLKCYEENCVHAKKKPIQRIVQQMKKKKEKNEIYSSFNLAGSLLTGEELQIIFRSLVETSEYAPEKGEPWDENIQYNKLNLSYNSLHDDILSLYRFLQRVPFQQILLREMGLSHLFWKEISQSVDMKAPLSMLDLSYNSLGRKGSEPFILKLNKKDVPMQMYVFKNASLSPSLGALFGLLVGKAGLCSLCLSGNERVGDEGIGLLAKQIGGGRSVRLSYLDVSGCRVSGRGFHKLATVLGESGVLDHLCIGKNDLGSEGAKALVTLIQSKIPLRHLDISRCNITDTNMRSVLESLNEKRSHLITSFVLNGNSIGKKTLAPLIHFLTNSPKLSTLGAGELSIPKSSLLRLLSSLQALPSLTSLDLSGTTVLKTEATLTYFTKTLKNMKSLVRLNLSAIPFEPGAIQNLFWGFKEANVPQKLHLNDQKMSEGSLAMIGKCLSLEHPLKIVSLRRCSLTLAGLCTLIQTVKQERGPEGFEILDLCENLKKVEVKQVRDSIGALALEAPIQVRIRGISRKKKKPKIKRVLKETRDSQDDSTSPRPR